MESLLTALKATAEQERGKAMQIKLYVRAYTIIWLLSIKSAN